MVFSPVPMMLLAAQIESAHMVPERKLMARPVVW
jgi:hypothetical protein